MRIRATVAVLSGTLALSALALPAAQAADGPNLPKLNALAKAPTDDAEGDTKITKVTVNGGKDIVVGTTEKKKFKIAVTATDPKGVIFGSAFLWHGTDFDSETGVDGALIPDNLEGKCVVVNATTSTCTVSVIADPRTDLYSNVLAGKWHVAATAGGKDGDFVSRDTLASDARVQRAAKLTTNASPEPVKKGKTLTITGALTRANWETHKYAGYTGQSVKLEFKKKGASTYTAVKTVKSGSKGALKTTVKASADGSYRYTFGGTSTTPAVKSAGDLVDVR
ncbi:calcium-binding protein [Streptomyces sp. NPDC003006]